MYFCLSFPLLCSHLRRCPSFINDGRIIISPAEELAAALAVCTVLGVPVGLFLKAGRTRPLCGASHVEMFKLTPRHTPAPPSTLHPDSPRRFSFLGSHYCCCKAHRHNALPLSLSLFSHTHARTQTSWHTPRSVTRSHTHTKKKNITNADAALPLPPLVRKCVQELYRVAP